MSGAENERKLKNSGLPCRMGVFEELSNHIIKSVAFRQLCGPVTTCAKLPKSRNLLADLQ